MRTMFKKAVALLMATAVVVSGATAVNGATASAAKKAKSKTYKVQTWCSGVQGKNKCFWIAGDGTSKNSGKLYVKNVKITKGKKTKVTITIKNPTKKKITAGTVFAVDVIDILKDYKKNKVKITGVTVKADGKKKKAKAFTGSFEPKTKPYNYRVSVYNEYGNNGDNSKKVNKAKNFAFKKKLSISFTIVAK